MVIPNGSTLGISPLFVEPLSGDVARQAWIGVLLRSSFDGARFDPVGAIRNSAIANAVHELGEDRLEAARWIVPYDFLAAGHSAARGGEAQLSRPT